MSSINITSAVNVKSFQKAARAVGILISLVIIREGWIQIDALLSQKTEDKNG